MNFNLRIYTTGKKDTPALLYRLWLISGLNQTKFNNPRDNILSSLRLFCFSGKHPHEKVSQTLSLTLWEGLSWRPAVRVWILFTFLAQNVGIKLGSLLLGKNSAIVLWGKGRYGGGVFEFSSFVGFYENDLMKLLLVTELLKIGKLRKNETKFLCSPRTHSGRPECGRRCAMDKMSLTGGNKVWRLHLLVIRDNLSDWDNESTVWQL